MLQEFKKFAMRGSVVDLAIGVIIGAAFGKIIDSMVNDIMMPIIGRIFGGLDFTNNFIGLTPAASQATTYDAAKKTFTYQSEDFDPASGKKMKGRDILRIDGDDQQTFEMYRQPAEVEGKEFKVLEIVYTRKK